MRSVGVLLLACASLLVSVQSNHQVVYAGFDHVISFNLDGQVSATAYDFRRFLAHTSVCEILSNPPLILNAPVTDWVIGASEHSELEFTFMGYENLLLENKHNGNYVARRCRDFRPQLTTLPCEVYATGNATIHKRPWKTIFIGSNRALFLNLETAEFVVHPFDADVHTGGDPFKLDSGPLFAGHFPEKDLASASFAYANLPGDMVSILFVQNHGLIKGYRFHGRAKDESEFGLNLVVQVEAPTGFTISTIEENDLLLSNGELEFMRWSVDRSAVNGSVVFEFGSAGEPGLGPNCIIDNATACVGTHGCAWCPSSYTCHAYDKFADSFCDRHACTVPALVDSVKAGQAVIVPPCISNPDPESVHADIFDTIDQGYNDLPGNIRHPPSYRNDEGLHAHAEAAPIHPSIDNELGDDPVVVSGEYPADQLIHENNKISQGHVYLPPGPSSDAHDMDYGYNPEKSADGESAELGQSKMNHVVTHLPEVHLTSPAGDSNEAHQIAAVRAEHNEEVRIGGEEPYHVVHDPVFVPRPIAQPLPLSEYRPASVSSIAEEDMMNGDKTKHSVVAPDEWVNDADKRDLTRSVKRVSEPAGFKPREPVARALEPKPVAPEVIREAPLNPGTLMNQGVGVHGLNNADCTENGGQDAGSVTTLNEAMMNSVKSDFPDTLEKQLDLFKDEPKYVEDPMPVPSYKDEEHLKHDLSAEHPQPAQPHVIDKEHDLAVNTNDDHVIVGTPGTGVTAPPTTPPPHIDVAVTPDNETPTIPTYTVPIPDCDEKASNVLMP